MVRGAHAGQDAAAAARDIGNGGIVLMHDSGPASMALVGALDSFLARLQRRGYAFATVSELIRSSPGPGHPGRTSSDGIYDAEE